MVPVFSRSLLPTPLGYVYFKKTNMVVYPRNVSLHQQFVRSLISNKQSLPNRKIKLCSVHDILLDND